MIPARLGASRKQPHTNRDQARTQSRERQTSTNTAAALSPHPHLETQPLAANTRRTYAGRVGGYLNWLAECN